MKIAIVQDDPFEESRRAVLNLGHTFAYAFEHVGGGALNHGEAVGIGLVAAARLSESVGRAAPGLAGRVESLVSGVGLVTSLPTAMPSTPRRGAASGQEAQGGKLRFVCCATSATR